jgi:hypothetical protein
VAVVLGGGPQTPLYPVSAPGQAVLSLTRTPAEAEAILASGPPSTYARLGGNDDGGHAMGLGAWTLACPRFHQYWFDPPGALADVTRCLPKAHVVYVASSFSQRHRPGQAAGDWNAWVVDTEKVLKKDFACHRIAGGDRLCVRKAEG